MVLAMGHKYGQRIAHIIDNVDTVKLSVYEAIYIQIKSLDRGFVFVGILALNRSFRRRHPWFRLRSQLPAEIG